MLCGILVWDGGAILTAPEDNDGHAGRDRANYTNNGLVPRALHIPSIPPKR